MTTIDAKEAYVQQIKVDNLISNLDSNLDVYIYDDTAKLIGFEIPDEVDNFLNDLGATNEPYVSLDSVSLNIHWNHIISIYPYGVGSNDDPEVDQVSGNINWSVTIEDPISGEYKEYLHSIEFDSKDWEINIDVSNREEDLNSSFISVDSIEIQYEKKEIIVNFLK